MPTGFFRAIAVDYDGTLSHTRRPEPDVLAAIESTRRAGYLIVLVTGRILSELRADFADVDEHFDAIVGENGAVIVRDGVERLLAPAADTDLLAAVRAAGAAARAGQVILATEAAHDRTVLDLITQFGLEHQLVHNRSALMVVPPGVSKGAGVVTALADLGVSSHNAIGVGDAENDHSLLEACEIGVAVANAVPSLRARADLVLENEGGQGVIELLRVHLPTKLQGVRPRRRCVLLGSTADGETVSIPSSRLNIGIYGESGRGKSYLAGLIAETLVTNHYLLCVLDLEGDHAGLADLPGVVVLGGTSPLPSSDELRELLRHGAVSVVIDLSLQPLDVKHQYSLTVIEQCQMMQDVAGVPHWIVIEEAHIPLAAASRGCGVLDEPRTGLCVVSYHPDQMCDQVDACTEARITVHAPEHAELQLGTTPPVSFQPSPRRLVHARHSSKYLAGRLPHARRFYFRGDGGETGDVVANLPEFRRALQELPSEVLLHHARHRDFSRWLGDLSYDRVLRETVRRLEQELADAPDPRRESESWRGRIAAAITERYP